MKYLILDKEQRIDIKNDIPSASLRIIEELKNQGIDNDFAYLSAIEVLFDEEGTHISANGKDLKDYTHIIFRGHSLGDSKEYETKRLIVDYIEEKNIVNQDNPTKIQNADAIKNMPYYSKIWMAQICSSNNIPWVKSLYRPDGDYAMKQELVGGYPYIIKHYYGENDLRIIDGKEKIKKNVYKIDKIEDLSQEGLSDKDLKNFFIQEFLTTGEDMRIFVSNNKIVGGWKRKATQGFMTVSKGEYTIYNEPEEEIAKLALKTAEAFKADFIATDFMLKDGKPYLQEISLHPGFKAYEEKATGGTPNNIAKAIIESFR